MSDLPAMEFAPAPTRASLCRYVVDRNPFYLLSAVCMLLGCILLTNSTSWSPIKLNRLLILTAALNFYELLLIGLALFLIVRRGLRRDGAILLVLEAFFLVDVTFLNSEIFSTDLGVGLLVNSTLLMLAMLKVGAIFYGLGIALGSGAFAITMIELAMLFTLPGAFKKIATDHAGTLDPRAIYAAWWTIGLIPVLATVLLRDPGRFTPLQRQAYRASRGIVMMFMILPVVSLLAHVCTSNWIYNIRWYPANVAPLMLGLAVAIGASDRHVSSMGWRMRWNFVLPIIALVMAARFPSSLLFNVGPVGFSPLRCTLVGAIFVYSHGYVLHRHLLFAWAACACLGAAGIGLSIRQILDNINLTFQQTFLLSKRLWPRTMTHWGIVSMTASFVLLVLGAWVSLRKPVRVELVQEGAESSA